MPDLLIELFSEEIPARMQARARDDLKRLVTDGLVQAGLTYASAGAFSTPRRLALTVEGLSAQSPDTREERKGPRTDAPEKALEGFLRGAGLTRDQLQVRDDKKGQVWFAVIARKGRPASEIVAEVLETTIRDFPWPKSMRWGTGSLRWVRPLHSILCILSDESGATTVPLNIDGIASGNSTRGHRFLSPDAFTVTGFDDYVARLRRAHVMLDPAEREAEIRQQAENLAFARGWQIVPDDTLLSEVAGLVEWPVPLMGVIEDRFLDLPPEVLQTSMKEHQKFFSARNPKTGRIEGFVTVANIATPDDGETILAGNQRVLAARLSDAAFFWENDLREAKSGMNAWAEGLKSVTFHNKMGSQADRIARVAALAREIAPMVGADPDQAETAARVAKLDLQSAMVGEFPELQGIMGRYYAQAAGYPDAVADAARDHYSPLGPSDAVPTAPVSVAVALADKIDTLTGFWAIDEKPTGSKDPFALRRAALGTIRLIVNNVVRSHLLDAAKTGLLANFSHQLNTIGEERTKAVDLAWETIVAEDGRLAKHAQKIFAKALNDRNSKIDWNAAVEKAKAQSPDRVKLDPDRPGTLNHTSHNLLAFLHDRLKVHLRDQGIRHDIIDAVLAQPGNDDLVLVVNRATALNAMLQTEDGRNLTQGLKRAGNILAQAEEKDGVEYSFGADAKFAETDQERALFAALDKAEPAIRRAIADEDFPAAMTAIAALRAPIDAFFEAVQVNSDNQILRRNRLNLLSRIRNAGREIADFTKIEG
ncbi:MAG: glycine--tRNA ligase subunit beta [Paracoccus sp. (in: a-proteobacteria)]|jgi:glycyl-tRNA synthetase beta chain|uniref:glycine--tRNA ligase subunit beta n=2 Tax=Paracoccus TaxID=265 RepID=UPI000C689CAA|nr:MULTISPECIES: glycine--tRNA ligase subunit beta [unclassified Paracoccus (in: a-proteobacteria)]MAN57859.1 glycine--tRNA ligase subunit beta [Paracoccus sp. (in: a-proteobacteria)]MCS5601410.1 glycine--tRNA ligase subunit beta [Paracoccus sp. (in: a-proteobacteria)]|tara:strand:+ start:292 stop:2583 length:2292 start_codon:yes stop_codon:yes gene_type:complete